MSAYNNLETDSARVFVSYSAVPDHPGPGWTRFVCISDTHSRVSYKIPPGDVLLHAGDLSSWGYPDQLRKTLKWLKELPHSVKIIIAGNHDLCLDEDLHPEDRAALDESQVPPAAELLKELRQEDMVQNRVFYLQDDPFSFLSASGKIWKVYGSPVSKLHARGAFQYVEHSQAEAIYQRIPADTEILLTHTPPRNTLDRTSKGVDVGCRRLARRLRDLSACRLHVFGHIHEAFGAMMVEESKRVAVNAAISRAPCAVIVDLKDDIINCVS